MTDPTSKSAIMAFDRTRNDNADLILDLRDLGYIPVDPHARVVDPTYGMGTFWSKWEPPGLVVSDIDPAKTPEARGKCIPTLGRADARNLPLRSNSVECVVLDPPYKLNGTPDPAIDGRYGVHVKATVADRMALIEEMVSEAARVVKLGGTVLVKCQDQVVSGHVVWQTDIITKRASQVDLDLIDKLHLNSYRAQPAGRRQVHARRNYSTMLIFKKGMK